MRTSSRPFAVMLFDEADLLDFAAVLQVVSEAGRHWNWRPFKVTTVGAQAGQVTTRDQISVIATHDFASCPRPEIVLVPGGYGARRVARDDGAMSWLRHVGKEADYILAVGAGVLVAVTAGLIEGHRVAARGNTAVLLRECAQPLDIDDETLVVDAGKVMTAAASSGAFGLGIALVAKVLGEKQAKRVADDLGASWPENVEAERAALQILEPGGNDC